MKHDYFNIDNIPTEKAWKQFRRWRAERKKKLKTKDYSYIVPSVEPDVTKLQNNRKHTTITWIGHSTFLLQIGGLNIVTDPVWATRMAMEPRLTSPGISLEHMPPIDIILISHSHYDHLHMKSLRKLITAHTLLIVPSGLALKMVRKGFIHTQQLAWWEGVTFDQVRITFVPAQHWTRRTITDMNRSHWGGYVIEKFVDEQGRVRGKENLHTIYFAGDSGYFRGFTMTGKRFHIDVALLPIGAYDPEWFMSQQHITPEQAVQVLQDVNAKVMIPMHYGAFKLADDTPKEALDRLEAERIRKGIQKEQIRLLAHGETWYM